MSGHTTHNVLPKSEHIRDYRKKPNLLEKSGQDGKKTMPASHHCPSASLLPANSYFTRESDDTVCSAKTPSA